jgi:hypothetical protein
MNEAFNNICTWFAPKNKVFTGSFSLHIRIGLAVGINSIGVLEYFKRLFRKLGITMTNNVVRYLTIKEANRVKKHDNGKTSTAKKEKNKRKYEKLKANMKKAKLELTKYLGTYRKGINLDAPKQDLLDGGNGDEVQQGARKPPAKKRSTGHCKYCGKLGHATKKSKKCIASADSNKKYRRVDGTLLTGPPCLPVAAFADHAQDDSIDCDNFDSMPPLVAMAGEELSFDVDASFEDAAMAAGFLVGGNASDDDSVNLVGGSDCVI